MFILPFVHFFEVLANVSFFELSESFSQVFVILLDLLIHLIAQLFLNVGVELELDLLDLLADVDQFPFEESSFVSASGVGAPCFFE